MKTTRMLVILVLVLASAAIGAQKLTVNGQDISSITLKAGQSCTVEVVSDDETSYAGFLGFDGGQSAVLGTFTHLETKPEAGNMASVALVSEPTFYGYSVWARSHVPGHPSPGVHFVFEYTAQELGQTELKFYDETRTVLRDSIDITIIGSESGTGFTYQGRLIDANRSAYGLYDFEFALYDSPDVHLGAQLGGTIDINELDVIDGLFEVTLDFGSEVFDGNALWLEIAVRPSDSNDPNDFVTLSPRQKITPTPYSLHSLYALRTEGVFLDAARTLVGIEAGANDAGIMSTSLGAMAGYSNTGNFDTFLGYQAGYSNAGSYNLFSGYQAGYSNTTGAFNTFLGYMAGLSNSTGGGNTFLGTYAGQSNVAGPSDTFVGYQAGYSNTTGSSNTFSGYQAGYSNTTGYQNTFSGYQAGYSNTTGHSDAFLGYQAGYHNTSALNTFLGHQSGYWNTTGGDNTFLGGWAGCQNTTGSYNTFLGSEAGFFNTTGGGNTFIGYRAGYNNTGGSNTFIGYRAGCNNTGSENTFTGEEAGASTTSERNTFSGYQAGYSNTTGNRNVYVGWGAGHNNTTGTGNVFLGTSAGYNNTTGHNNIFIGYGAGFDETETGSNKLCFESSGGILIYGDFSTGRVGLGTKTLNYRLQLPNTADAGGKGQANAWVTYSSKRWKTNIQPIEDALEKVQGLRGVYFDWKSNGKHDIGLIAEEVAEVVPEVVGYEEDSGYASSLDYARLVALLVEAVKAQQQKITELEQALEQNQSLAKRIEAIEVGLSRQQLAVAKEVQ